MATYSTRITMNTNGLSEPLMCNGHSDVLGLGLVLVFCGCSTLFYYLRAATLSINISEYINFALLSKCFRKGDSLLS